MEQDTRGSKLSDLTPAELAAAADGLEGLKKQEIIRKRSQTGTEATNPNIANSRLRIESYERSLREISRERSAKLQPGNLKPGYKAMPQAVEPEKQAEIKPVGQKLQPEPEVKTVKPVPDAMPNIITPAQQPKPTTLNEPEKPPIVYSSSEQGVVGDPDQFDPIIGDYDIFPPLSVSRKRKKETKKEAGKDVRSQIKERLEKLLEKLGGESNPEISIKAGSLATLADINIQAINKAARKVIGRELHPHEYISLEAALQVAYFAKYRANTKEDKDRVVNLINQQLNN